MNKVIILCANILGYFINFIYKMVNNYGITIILFTILSKIILFPINLIIQKNSIKMVKIKPELERLKIKYANDKEKFMDEQIKLYEKEKYRPILGVFPLLIQIPIILGLIRVLENSSVYIENLHEVSFETTKLLSIPTLNSDLIIPIIAGLSTVLLCIFQNRLNVLQQEENIISKLATAIITICITVWFTFLVPIGVSIYWICGNILAIIQLYILNFIYPPKEYLDYEELLEIKKMKKDMARQEKIKNEKSKYYYKRFFEIDNINDIKLVFFSEESGFYKYFKGMIEFILKNSNIKIHYITNDINDKIFEYNNSQLIPYYINTNHLIPLFMKMECDIVVMTTPDLQNLYLKRSIVKKDIEYIFTDHGLTSCNLSYKRGALDNYDTIFATTKQQIDEIRAIEEQRGTKRKLILKTGYSLIDEMICNYESRKNIKNDRKVIMIAPSWQEDNIMESCLEEMVLQLLKTEYKIIIRPHPYYIKNNLEKINYLMKKYKNQLSENFIIQDDFSSTEDVYNSDLVITDWSAIGYEFSFTTSKPCLFINTKIKILNPDYNKIKVRPLDVELRNVIGKSIEKNEINSIIKIIDELINSQEMYIENNKKIRSEYLLNIGKSSELQGKYIIERILNGKSNMEEYMEK